MALTWEEVKQLKKLQEVLQGEDHIGRNEMEEALRILISSAIDDFYTERD